LAKIAADNGAHGFVCSPEETRELRATYPDKIIVNPGVRSDSAPKNDQARIATPFGAMVNGANYIVMGRQILTAKDPVVEVERVRREELSLSSVAFV
jgi:orotidine-5'-phosphate decarboxylase